MLNTDYGLSPWSSFGGKKHLMIFNTDCPVCDHHNEFALKTGDVFMVTCGECKSGYLTIRFLSVKEQVGEDEFGNAKF